MASGISLGAQFVSWSLHIPMFHRIHINVYCDARRQTTATDLYNFRPVAGRLQRRKRFIDRDRCGMP